jgi:chromosome segregation ATPase
MMMEAQMAEQLPLIFRMNSLEQDISELKKQLVSYVPLRENDLQLRGIRDIVDRIERDVIDTKKNLGDINTRLVEQEVEVQRKEAALRENQSALQIKVLWGAISLIITGLTSVLIGYITHFFH